MMIFAILSKNKSPKISHVGDSYQGKRIHGGISINDCLSFTKFGSQRERYVCSGLVERGDGETGYPVLRHFRRTDLVPFTERSHGHGALIRDDVIPPLVGERIIPESVQSFLMG